MITALINSSVPTARMKISNTDDLRFLGPPKWRMKVSGEMTAARAAADSGIRRIANMLFESMFIGILHTQLRYW